MRFTNTRAVVGAFGSVIHFASVSRESSAFGGSECRKAGTPGFTVLVGLSQSPRRRMAVMRGSSRGARVKVLAPSGHCAQSLSILSFASFQSGRVVRQ